MKIPLLSDLTHQISKDYGVYLEDQGHTLRCGFPSTKFTEIIYFLRGFNGLEMLNLVLNVSEGSSSLMKKASWGRSPWTIFQWEDQWMRLSGWSRPSSTQTNMEKVQAIKVEWAEGAEWESAPTYAGVASKAAAQQGVLYLAVCPAGWKPGSDTVSIIQPRWGGGIC